MKLTAVGVIVGEVVKIKPHPNADSLRIATVKYSPTNAPLQVIFGGLTEIVRPGSLVPLAPPSKSCRVQGVKMRRRRYRGIVSEGELCSLYELGLTNYDTDQVAVLAGQPAIGTPIEALLHGIDPEGKLVFENY